MLTLFISSDGEKDKVWQYTCKKFQLFQERVIYDNFYQNQ